MSRILQKVGVLFILLVIAACGPSPESGPVERPGKAPDFALRDLQGEIFHLDAERGKMVLIIFTTTWCPSCRESIPLYKDIQEVYGKRGLVVVNVDIQEPLERLSQFATKHRLPYRVLLDTEGSVSMAFGVIGVPALYLINQEGEIISDQALVILEILARVYPDADLKS
ncbi:MAG: TlpA family protein disulfide reductase [Syntrophaceae bacterium]|nr:TlpA family protein disulfide reductase [Syntrophaceae bacterium]